MPGHEGQNTFDRIYIEKTIFRYYTQKHGDTRGWGAKHVRYDIYRVFFRYYVKNTGMPGDGRRNKFDTIYRTCDIPKKTCFDIIQKKHGDARGWKAKHVRCDIYRKKHISILYTKKTRGCQAIDGETSSIRHIEKTIFRYFT